MKNIVILASSLGLALAAFAAEPATDGKTANPATIVYDDKSAFEYIKTLAGNWERAGAPVTSTEPVPP
jgi:folate-dependent phosphoribosylglycinamide formyltransferase PurN